MDDAAGGLPWILYGAGVSPDLFAWQLRHAGAAGACGFLVGRTVWIDALVEDVARAGVIARDLCRPRFETLAGTARQTCRAVPG
jgi:tagatose 1,6-diphosphate aldolase